MTRYWLHAYSQERQGGERLYANSVDRLSPAAFLKKLVTDFPESASLLHWSTEITLSSPRWTDTAEAAFEKWWQNWRQQNLYPNTQRMRDAARAVYESLTSGSIDTMVEQLREQGHLRDTDGPASKRHTAIMTKRLPTEAKMSAYNEAIDFLRAQESDSDTPADVDARHWLADKLDKECDRWLKALKRDGDMGGSR